MTKNFDTLLESMLTEMAASWKGATREEQEKTKKEFVRRVADISRAAPMSGHYKVLKQIDEKGKMQLAKFLLRVCREILWDTHPVTNAPFSYNPKINTKKDLKALILPAVQKVAKKSGWAQKFLSDRLNTQMVQDLAFEVVSGSVDNGEEVTQKQIRDQIKKSTEEFATPEGQKARLERSAQKRQPIQSADFSTSSSYQLIPPSEKDLNRMSEEERKTYEAALETGAEEESTGREMVDAAKRAGVSVSQIEKILQKFVNNEILISAEKEKSQAEDFDETSSGEIPTIEDDEFSSRFDDELEDYENYLK